MSQDLSKSTSVDEQEEDDQQELSEIKRQIARIAFRVSLRIDRVDDEREQRKALVALGVLNQAQAIVDFDRREGVKLMNRGRKLAP